MVMMALDGLEHGIEGLELVLQVEETRETSRHDKKCKSEPPVGECQFD
jgi:hypothetical protein